MMPFTPDQFFQVFAAQNLAFWPWQIPVQLTGLALIAVAWKCPRGAPWVGPLGLGLAWAAVGIGYHWAYFTAINPAAWGFGAAFVVQAGLFVEAAARGALRFGRPVGWRGWAGTLALVYALIGYPVAGFYEGHQYPFQPLFGLTPCPTAIYTWGLLLWSRTAVPRRLLVIPAAWAAIGGSAAVAFGVTTDLGLALIAVVGLVGLWPRTS